MSWRPSASLATLKESALLRNCVRRWMDERGILEVLTPVASRFGTTDPNVPSVVTENKRYLQTSPEFPMKRLLAAHSEVADKQPDIYQIASVFRAGESGRRHNTEFTLLEWYRVGMDHHALIEDAKCLLSRVSEAFDLPWHEVSHCRYGVEVRNRLGVWPEDATPSLVEAYFVKNKRSYPEAIGDDLDSSLDLFVDEFVLPDFSGDRFTIVMDYPASQAALSRLGRDQDNRLIAQRFEIYYGQVELANGFHELSDSDQQRERFVTDLEKRKLSGLAMIPMDVNLIDALENGLPDCAGIALGLDRLLMVLKGYKTIQEVLSFDDQRA